MSAAPIPQLPDPPRGFRYYHAREEVLRAPEMYAYQHMLLRAWDEMRLSGVLTLNGTPTVYVRDESKPVTPEVAAKAHLQFWNQGVATVLLLRDPEKVRVFSSMKSPTDPKKATEREVDERLVEQLDLATQASWAQRFYVELGTGHYYGGDREEKFQPKEAVDAYLLDNLAAVRDSLVDQQLEPQFAHTFLGRLLFTCYLCDREIVALPDYFKGRSWRHLHELLADSDNPIQALYVSLFPALQRDFNGNMYDDILDEERSHIRREHIELVHRFLNGDDIAKGRGQRSLGFWAYDFKFIPVETISAIYENFLESENRQDKRAAGAFYTPRFLADMALDMALGGVGPLFAEGRRFLDSACGSGIFLVLLFNRLAAEWRAEQVQEPTPQAKATALLKRLDSLCGVDKNLTACRISCFSLYLAFLDQFDPPHVKAYKLHTGKRLPNLLLRKGGRRAPEHPVVHEADFFEIAPNWRGRFDLAIGNPPWAGRGKKQIAHRFMEETPRVLKPNGRACLLLPSKVFLNQTDAFQSRWLRNVTVERVVQLADYSFILFKESLCPCNIVLFSTRRPDETTHEIEYDTPKVSRADLRDGVIEVAPEERKWIPLRFVLAAAEQRASSIAWKSRLWGTPRDLKLLDYLCTFPRLGDLAGTVTELKRGKKRWCEGQGFKPLRTIREGEKTKRLRWPPSDPFVTPELINDLFVLPSPMAYELGSYLKSQKYRLDRLHRSPDERIYGAPLVLVNQGFSTAIFFDYTVRFQHALQSVSGTVADTESLMWLAAVLRSKLARYFVFHTAANLGTERDKVHMFEVLRVPFFLPDNKEARPEAGSIMKKAIAKIRKLKTAVEADARGFLGTSKEPRAGELFYLDDEERREKERAEWFGRQRNQARALQGELDLLVYEYFGIDAQERALIEDTCEIFDKSDTPASLEAAKTIPTLQSIDPPGLQPYATMLTEALNGWATGSVRVRATGGVDREFGLGLVEVSQCRTPQGFETRDISHVLASALQKLQDASAERMGRFEFRRSGWIFNGTHVYLVKPALLGCWTRSSALNDAAELAAHIAEARRQARTQ